jgi:hypothetical protein
VKPIKFRATLPADGSHIEVAIDPKATFGTVRAPVQVTLNGYTYPSTIMVMRGLTMIPLRKSHREAAGVAGGQTYEITLVHDTAPRTVEAPADLKRALKVAGMLPAWQALSYTHQREHVEAIEGAKAADTRARRIAAAVKAMSLSSRTARRR